MNAQSWLRETWQAAVTGWRDHLAGPGMGDGYATGMAGGLADDLGNGLRGAFGSSGAALRGLTGRSLELAEVQAEVVAESRGQILMVGRSAEASRRLLAHLRGQPPAPLAGPVSREGFFTLATLPPAAAAGPAPGCAGAGGGWPPGEIAREPGAATGRWPAQEDEPAYAWWTTESWLDLAREADILLYVFPQDVGWQADDARWYARLRAAGQPMVLVAVDLAAAGAPGGDLRPDEAPTVAGERPAVVCLAEAGAFPGEAGAFPGEAGAFPGEAGAFPGEAGAFPGEAGAFAGEAGAFPGEAGAFPGDYGDGADAPLSADVVALVERILAQRPRLAIPLAQEIPGCRPLIARRAIRSATLITTLLGAEPIPLLDLPLQVAVNWKLALQLAAIYGHPGLDHRSREMAGAVLWNLALRYVIQQALKLAPVLGWIGSATLSGAGSWIFGTTLLRYYQADGRPLADVALWVRAQGRRTQVRERVGGWLKKPAFRGRDHG